MISSAVPKPSAQPTLFRESMVNNNSLQQSIYQQNSFEGDSQQQVIALLTGEEDDGDLDEDVLWEEIRRRLHGSRDKRQKKSREISDV